MDKRQIETLCKSDLLGGIGQQFIEDLLKHQNTKIQDFLRMDTIFPADKDYGLCVLLKGTAECYNGQTLLNTYKEGDTFGAASLFCDSPYPTVITARSSGTALYIGKAAVEHLVGRYPEFAIKYINLLSKKIYLLNRKIDSFTADNSYKKVAKYLYTAAAGKREFQLGLSLTRLCATLDIGRASLYRALDTLESDGIISRQGRNIHLIDTDKLNTII